MITTDINATTKKQSRNSRFTKRTSANLGRSHHRFPHVYTQVMYGKFGGIDGYRLIRGKWCMRTGDIITFWGTINVHYMFPIIAGCFAVAQIEHAWNQTNHTRPKLKTLPRQASAGATCKSFVTKSANRGISRSCVLGSSASTACGITWTCQTSPTMAT